MSNHSITEAKTMPTQEMNKLARTSYLRVAFTKVRRMCEPTTSAPKMGPKTDSNAPEDDAKSDTDNSDEERIVR